jgi:hypothetical protein
VLSWEVQGADTVTLVPGGSVAAVGADTVTPDTSSTWWLVVEGAGGRDSSWLHVHVFQPPRVERFASSPDTVLAGGATRLTWLVTGADSVQVLPGLGRVSDTTVLVFLDGNTAFTLTAMGRGGVRTATLTVIALTPVPVDTVSFATATGTGSITLRWRQIAGATGYELERTPTYGGGYQWLAGLDSARRSYFDSGLMANAVYQYRLRAQTPAGPTAWLMASSIAAPPPPEAPPPAPISPGQVTLSPWNTQRFTTPATSPRWFVLESDIGGRISADGLYQAPSRPGVYHVGVVGVGLPSYLPGFATVVAQ